MCYPTALVARESLKLCYNNSDNIKFQLRSEGDGNEFAPRSWRQGAVEQ